MLRRGDGNRFAAVLQMWRPRAHARKEMKHIVQMDLWEISTAVLPLIVFFLAITAVLAFVGLPLLQHTLHVKVLISVAAIVLLTYLYMMWMTLVCILFVFRAKSTFYSASHGTIFALSLPGLAALFGLLFITVQVAFWLQPALSAVSGWVATRGGGRIGRRHGG